MEEYSSIRHISPETLKYKVSGYIDKGLLYGLDYYIEELDIDYMVEELSLKLKAHQLKEKVVRYPKDWWQALKERFAPEWFKRRYPVEYEEVKLEAYEVLKNKVLDDDSSEIFIMKNCIEDWE